MVLTFLPNVQRVEVRADEAWRRFVVSGVAARLAVPTEEPVTAMGVVLVGVNDDIARLDRTLALRARGSALGKHAPMTRVMLGATSGEQSASLLRFILAPLFYRGHDGRFLLDRSRMQGACHRWHSRAGKP